MNEIYLKKLWDALQGNFDVGTYEEFKSHMGTPELRKKFYDVITAEHFDIGPYDAYESHLSGQLISLHYNNQQEFKDQVNTKWYVCKDGFPVDGIPYGCKSNTIRTMKHLLGLNDPNDGVYGNELLKLLSDSGIIAAGQSQQYMKDHSFKITQDVYDKIYQMKHPNTSTNTDTQLHESIKIAVKKALKSYFK